MKLISKKPDINVAAGLIFRKGKIIKKCPKRNLMKEFLKEIYSFEEMQIGGK